MIKIFKELDKELIGIYLEHRRISAENEPQYQLNKTLFSINEPFFMKSEKEALIRDGMTESNPKPNAKRNKRKLNKKQFYEMFFTERHKHLINNIINEVKQSLKCLSINSTDNTSAQQLAQMTERIDNFEQYFDKLLSNLNDFSVVSDGFIIPPKSSFMCSDVIKGLEEMKDNYIKQKFKVSEEFIVVIDPPWSNKSVKRKRCYQTDDNKNILEMTKHLYLLLQLFPKQTDIRVCVWTTHKEKDFVINQMLSQLNCKCTHVLIWHKITTSGQSVKIRGNLEYLIIASNIKSDETECHNHMNGILVSIPSAIHSHKPPLQELVNHLFPNKCVKSDAINAPVVQMVSSDSELNSVGNQRLSQSINSCVSGLELYARYLNSGFHSIGLQTIKLQNHILFS